MWDQLKEHMHCTPPVDLISEITALGLTFLKGELVQRPGVLKYIVPLHWTQQEHIGVKHPTTNNDNAYVNVCSAQEPHWAQGTHAVLQTENAYNAL